MDWIWRVFREKKRKKKTWRNLRLRRNICSIYIFFVEKQFVISRRKLWIIRKRHSTLFYFTLNWKIWNAISFGGDELSVEFAKLELKKEGRRLFQRFQVSQRKQKGGNVETVTRGEHLIVEKACGFAERGQKLLKFQNFWSLSCSPLQKFSKSRRREFQKFFLLLILKKGEMKSFRFRINAITTRLREWNETSKRSSLEWIWWIRVLQFVRFV